MTASASRSLTSATRVRPVSRPELQLIVNPRATRADADELAVAVRVLRPVFAVAMAHTEDRGHAVELARAAARDGAALVVAAGGDGTSSETAHGLAGSQTAMACLPTGCTNVFARSLGSPRQLVDAARRLAARQEAGLLERRRVDLGTVNGRHFVCTSGVGLSASMTAAVDAAPQRKARLGQLHFAAAAAAELGRLYVRNPPRMRVQAAGRSSDGVTAVVQNARVLTYFGPRAVHACDAAGLDTGAISLTLLRRTRPRDLAPVLVRLLSRGVGGHPAVESFPGLDAATIVSADQRLLPLEADGEFLGEHERIEYAVAPRALTVVV